MWEGLSRKQLVLWKSPVTVSVSESYSVFVCHFIGFYNHHSLVWMRVSHPHFPKPALALEASSAAKDFMYFQQASCACSGQFAVQEQGHCLGFWDAPAAPETLHLLLCPNTVQTPPANPWVGHSTKAVNTNSLPSTKHIIKTALAHTSTQMHLGEGRMDRPCNMHILKGKCLATRLPDSYLRACFVNTSSWLTLWEILNPGQ